MNVRQASVIQALQRVYGEDGILILDPDNDVIYALAVKDGITVLSVGIPDRQDPNRPDVGDRVYFEYNKRHAYGLIVVYRDMNDSVGIVPDGTSELVWDHVSGIEIAGGS